MQDYFQILHTKDKHMLKILVVAIATLQPPPNFAILGLLKDQILCEKTSVLVGTKLNMVGTLQQLKEIHKDLISVIGKL